MFVMSSISTLFLFQHHLQHFDREIRMGQTSMGVDHVNRPTLDNNAADLDRVSRVSILISTRFKGPGDRDLKLWVKVTRWT